MCRYFCKERYDQTINLYNQRDVDAPKLFQGGTPHDLGIFKAPLAQRQHINI